MKFLHLSFHFEFSDAIEQILERHEIRDFVRYPLIHGKDRDGKHDGSKVFPGNITVVQAQIPDDGLDPVLLDLGNFKKEKAAHRHLQALVLPVEKRL
jgi:hypothetical protein